MDLNKLVELISKEVLKELKKDTKKDCVLVLASRGCIDESTVLDTLGKDLEVLFLGDDLTGKSVVMHILPELSIEMMAQLAQGNSSDDISSHILRLLLSGVQIETFEYEYRSYENSAPSSLYELYENYEKTLLGFGLKPFVNNKPGTKRFRKELITENDILQADKNGVKTLMVSKRANITPLAHEAAKEMNIEFIKH